MRHRWLKLRLSWRLELRLRWGSYRLGLRDERTSVALVVIVFFKEVILNCWGLFLRNNWLGHVISVVKVHMLVVVRRLRTDLAHIIWILSTTSNERGFAVAKNRSTQELVGST